MRRFWWSAVLVAALVAWASPVLAEPPTSSAPAGTATAAAPASTGASTPKGTRPPTAGAPAGPLPGIGYGVGDPLVWPHHYRRFGPWHATATGVAIAGLAASFLVGPDEMNPRVGPVWVDEDIRNALRYDTYLGRLGYRDASDVLLTLNLSYPFIADALVNVAWYRASPDVAGQLALIDMEALAITVAVQQITAAAVGRERPYGDLCDDELDGRLAQCNTRDRYLSHFSGHTSLSFAAASVTCTHHAHLPLQAGHVEWLPCVASMLAAGTTGAFRIVADRHYFTDVAMGAAVGSLVGWLVPFLHYHTGTTPRAGGALDGRQFFVVPTGNGVAAWGTF